MTALEPVPEHTVDPRTLCTNCIEPSTGPYCPKCGWRRGDRASSPIYLPPGSILHSGQDQYLVGKVLGHGGFGITYLGYDPNLRKKVAIKEYFPSGVAIRDGSVATVRPLSKGVQPHYASGLERFLEEARTVRKLRNHVNIVRVENLFPANGTAYLVMEHLDGVTFLDYLKKRGGKTDWATLMRVMMPVLDALREVHHHAFLHRDISPDNIYLLRSGIVKVIDFGAARQSLGHASKNVSAVFKGGYTPPEQYQERGHQGPWTDIYAAAATMYRALTGVMPPSAPDRMLGTALKAPRDLGASMEPVHEQALMQALRVEAPRRFQTVGAFQNALRVEAKSAAGTPAVSATAAASGVPKWALPAAVAAILVLAMMVFEYSGARF